MERFEVSVDQNQIRQQASFNSAEAVFVMGGIGALGRVGFEAFIQRQARIGQAVIPGASGEGAN